MRRYRVGSHRARGVLISETGLHVFSRADTGNSYSVYAGNFFI